MLCPRRRRHYRLTPAGEDLRPIVEGLGTWSTRWITELGDADLDRSAAHGRNRRRDVQLS